MNAAAVANEFAKMRHHKVGVIAAFMVFAVLALSVVGALGSRLDPASPEAWNSLLAGMSTSVPLLSPLLLAVLASRHVDIEHQGGGWLLSTTSGLTPGGLCRSKFLALGAIIAAATWTESLLVLAAGKALGVGAPVPVGLWLGFTLCATAVGLVLLAVHILIAAKLENQLIGLGIAMLGTLVATFARGLPDLLAHATPWGYYALAQAAGYEGGQLVAMPPSYPSIAALAVATAILFGLITSRFDRQEA